MSAAPGTASLPATATATTGTGPEPVPRELIAATLDALRRGGAEYGDVYVEARSNRSLVSGDDSAPEASRGRQLGMGIRALRGDVSAFCCTENLDADHLLRTAAELTAGLGRAPAGHHTPLPLTARPSVQRSPVLVPGDTVPWSERTGLLERAQRAGRAADPRIIRATARLFESAHRIQVGTTAGDYRHETRSRVRLRVQVVARDRQGRTGYGSWAPGGTGGFEITGTLDPEAVAAEACRQALALLDAREAPAGDFPLVVHNGVGGVLFHEACGHPLEGDGLSRPGSPAAVPYGTRVASELITAVDDQTVPGAWGTAGFDDEGVPAQCTTLIENGRLVSHLFDRATAGAHGRTSTGNGRRASFRHLPVPRMTNTFLRPGEDDPEQIVRDTADGIYARSFSGGVVDTTTGSFTFTVREGYRIRGGRLAEPLSMIPVVGTGWEVLSRIDRVGHDLRLAPVICGKEGQKSMVGVGQPTVRISSVTVGGNHHG
jgi:TldD protein